MANHFEFCETDLNGLCIVKRRKLSDDRGYFSRIFCMEEFRGIGFNKQVVQINHTVTRRSGSVRGLHYQTSPHCETKIVSCIKGEIFDVAVDIRQGSPTFLKWHAEVLSAENQTGLYIPEGFAHGFQALTNDCEILYMHSESYEPSSEAALNVSDPLIGVAWPLLIGELSERDRAHPFIDNNFTGIKI